jgi:hypothetical protein
MCPGFIKKRIMKTVKITQSCVGLNFSYSRGEVVEMPGKEADSFIKHDQAIAYKPQPHDKVIPHPVPINQAKGSDNTGTGDLPEDCPARDILVEAELTTVEDVLNHDDLTMLNGIGDAMKNKIIDFLKAE